MNQLTTESRTKLLVLGWQYPPHNGRSQVVSGLTSSPFTTRFNVERYDTKLQNELGQRKLHVAVIRAIKQIFKFKRVAKRVKPDVAIFIIGPGVSFWHDMLILRQCHQLNIPTIVRFIGGRLAGELKTIPQPFRQLAYRQLSQAQVFLSETHEMNRDLSTQFPDISAKWTPNFIHEDDLSRPIVERYKTTFHFIGGETEQGYLDDFRQKASHLRHSDRVKVHGHLSRAQAHNLCRQCQIFTFPSQWHGEGQPASLIELMGLGLVPIVTRWRGLGDIVEDKVNGLSIERPDSAELADRILYLLDNPARLKSMSVQARKTICAQYTHTSAINQYQSLFVDSVGHIEEEEEAAALEQ